MARPWEELFLSPARSHRLGIVAVGLMLLWWLRAGITAGLGVHFLGMTAATLVLGWPLALIAGLAPVLGAAATGLEAWGAVGVTGFLTPALPVFVTAGVLHALRRWLPEHPFVDLLGAAFLGGVAAGLVARGSIAAFLVIADVRAPAVVLDQSWVIVLLTALPEGVVNGTIVSLLFAWNPDWLDGLRQ
ncbi:MAG: hypothetical protein U5K43_08735 [Halofilum sp. (in: g-proteobacteria)]|nr:hypothetical protein [Halofilum sp. (in: g-proteobacteria)]